MPQVLECCEQLHGVDVAPKRRELRVDDVLLAARALELGRAHAPQQPLASAIVQIHDDEQNAVGEGVATHIHHLRAPHGGVDSGLVRERVESQPAADLELGDSREHRRQKDRERVRAELTRAARHGLIRDQHREQDAARHRLLDHES